jgi:hypothetical protein
MKLRILMGLVLVLSGVAVTVGAESTPVIKRSAYCIKHGKDCCVQIKRMFATGGWVGRSIPDERPSCIVGGCGGRVLEEGECTCHAIIEKQLANKKSIATYHDQSGNILEISDVADQARIELQRTPVWGEVVTSIKGPSVIHLYDPTDCPVACLRIPTDLVSLNRIANRYHLREIKRTYWPSLWKGQITETVVRR